MIGPHCLLPYLPLIMVSAERSEKSVEGHPGGVSTDSVGDLSFAPLTRLRLSGEDLLI